MLCQVREYEDKLGNRFIGFFFFLLYLTYSVVTGGSTQAYHHSKCLRMWLLGSL